MIAVIATFSAKPGARDKVVELGRKCIELTNKEDGCISYELFASTENGTGLVFVERWRDKEALKVHLASTHLAKFKEDRVPFVEGPSEVKVFEAAPATL
jgi:quinol monooxygenase YgiN